MTQADQRQQNSPDAISASPRDNSMSPSHSSRPTTESISDNDTSEKPVREKLKKTSLASMSGNIVGRQERAFKANEGNPALDHMHRGSSPENEVNSKGVEPRGRPVKKRSYDNLDTPETESIEAGREHVAKLNANSHLRKRSRDVRTGELFKESRRPLLAGTPPREEVEDAANSFERSDAYVNGSKSAVDGKPPPTDTLSKVEMEQDKQLQEVDEPPQSISGAAQEHHVTETGKDSADQEMRDSAFSPQKKRSRDQFDTEADREQKIPATEEARAHRRSDELERGEISATTRNRSPVSPKASGVVGEEQVTAEKEKCLVQHPEVERQEQVFKSAFGSASTYSPSIGLSRNDSAKISTFATKTTDQESLTSGDAFASSGFAALAGSSTSPFGTLGGSSTATTGNPFTPAGLFNSRKTETDKKDTQKPDTAASSGFGTFVSSTSTGFGITDQSPFGTSGLSKTSGFGGSVFGSAFGGPLGGGNRLTSFAAPTGNARLGVSNGAIKPIGSPKRDEDDDENSESEGEGSAEHKKDEETEEVDGRFQHQDVETGEGGEDSIFSSRASLYAFRDNAWKESGKGTFKLNIALATPEDISLDRKTGRFIMRAHQTYRVLLNVPVFKQMQIGDSKGNEPSGKSFLFAVIENAKPVAHMLKLGDVMDSKALYHEVRRLQEGLE